MCVCVCVIVCVCLCVIGNGNVERKGKTFLTMEDSKSKFSLFQAIEPLRGSRCFTLLLL